jgi:hypothetical protein
MSRTAKRYAIGLKGWVQIRLALKEPKPITTEAKIEVPTQVGYVDKTTLGFPYGVYRFKTVMKPVTLKQVVYEGGRHIMTVSDKKFKSALNRFVPYGTMIEISVDDVKLIKEA